MAIKLPLQLNDDRLLDADGVRIAFGLTPDVAKEIMTALHARDALIDALLMVSDEVPMAPQQSKQVMRALQLVQPF